jgi:hypothetical protein
MVIKQKYIRAIHGDTGIWNQTPIIIVSKMALLWIWNADKFLIYKIPEYWKIGKFLICRSFFVVNVSPSLTEFLRDVMHGMVQSMWVLWRFLC